MQSIAEVLQHQPRQESRSATPLTDAGKFTITRLDVGTEAVRAGVVAEIEGDREVLIAAVKLALRRIEGRFDDALTVTALQGAIRVVEAGK